MCHIVPYVEGECSGNNAISHVRREEQVAELGEGSLKRREEDGRHHEA